GIIGVIFITIMSNTSGEKSSLIGMLFIFLALLCEGFYNIFSREESAKFDPMEITYVMMWFGAIGFNLINVCIRMANHTILSYFTPLLNSSNVVSLLYLGVLSSGVAYVMYNYALSKIPASSVNAFAGVVTVVTILSGVLLNNEKFLWFHAIGGILILLGAWGTNHFRAVYKLEEKVQKRVVEQEQVRF
ncbi:MAG: DMT family transporter, partial [Oscillospiraceae bacterium]